MGLLLMLMGVLSIVFTSIDIGLGVIQSPNSFNPNYKFRPKPAEESKILPSSWNENSIWPTLGKGIWVGLLVSN